MLYKGLIRPLIFRLHPEFVRVWTRRLLKGVGKIPLVRPLIRLFNRREVRGQEREVFGIRFANPVGLSCGIERDGRCLDEWADWGFSFIEVGPLTPLPQMAPKSGFRNKTARGIDTRDVNRGVMEAIANLGKRKSDVVVAAHLLFGRDSDPAQAVKDYQRTFSLLYDFVDFFVIPAYRPGHGPDDADTAYLATILDPLLDDRMGLEEYKPMVLRVMAPIPAERMDRVLDYVQGSGIDGISVDASQVTYVLKKTQGRLPVIASGTRSPQFAAETLAAGASLVETGAALAFEGLSIVHKILKIK